MSTRRRMVSPNASMMVVSTCTSFMALYNWHALRTCPRSVNATLLPCRGTASTDGPGNKIKSHRNGVFSFRFGFGLDLFVLLEVQSRLMFAIRLKCVELDARAWITLSTLRASKNTGHFSTNIRLIWLRHLFR